MTYLDDATVRSLRAELARLRRPGSYEPGKWSVGFLNREVAALGAHPPRKAYVRDITLRSVDEAPGVGIRDEEKVLIAEALARANIPSMQLNYFEQGFSYKEGVLNDLVKRIKDIKPDMELNCLASRTSDIETAAEIGMDKVKFAQVSAVGLIRAFLYEAAWEGKDWKSMRVPENVEQQLSRCLRLTQAAKRIPLKVSFGQNAATFVTEEYLRKIVPPLAEAGADEISFSDTYHGLGPEAWRYLCHLVRGMAPNIDIAVHIHNDWGMATSSAVACALGGANFIEVSINGVGGPGVGQADLAEVVVALEALYGIDTGVDMRQLTSLSRLMSDMIHREMPPWKPITGSEAWVYGNIDEFVTIYDIDPLLALPVNPELFGAKPRITGEVGCASGNWVMLSKLEQLGLEVEKSRVPGILDEVKQQVRLRKRPLTDDEIRSLVNK